MLARPGALSAPGVDPAAGRRSAALARAVRRVPIRWRILGIAVLNSSLALVLIAVIWNGAQVLGAAWADLRRVQQSERFLTSLGADAERLQSSIHRFFAQSEPAILARIVPLRETLVSRLRVQALLDSLLAAPTRPLTEITERFVAGFDDLRETRSGISLTYGSKILKPSKDMAALYAALAGSSAEVVSPLWPALDKSREAFNAMLLATNAYYLSGDRAAAREATAQAIAIGQAVPDMLALATEDAQRSSLNALREQAELFEEGLVDLGVWFATQQRLLRDSVDGNAQAMSAAIDAMRAGIQELERSAQTRFDRTLDDVALKLGILAVSFVAFVVLMGIGIARSISDPLRDLGDDMATVMAGRYDRPIHGLRAGDEIGQMARAVEVFREDAIARQRAEADLRRAKERAEATLAEIRTMQASLIEAEKLAALGGLVAGVAHEVNNPVGIGLTVASTLAVRTEAFAAEVATGQVRRSRLEAFTAGTRDAANQLVANLQRAAELVQSFKQVAVDRSHAERRPFDLRRATEQILASLRPSLKTTSVRLVVDLPDGLVMESYPGPFGQVLTNLFLNAVNHAFPDGEGGTISITGRLSAPGQVQLVFRDDGAGMTEEVQRQAFDPFFTTRRGAGGTGLGLHIVYNLVTRRLGGRIILSSAPGSGTTFLIVLPVVVPDEDAAAARLEDAHVGS